MSNTHVKPVNLDSLIALVKQVADIQAAEGVSGVGQSSTPLIDAGGVGGGLFPKDQVASSARPRGRTGAGLNPIELQLAEHDRERNLAVGLINSTKALEKSTAEAEAARKELEAFQDVLERRVIASMGHRSTARNERRIDNFTQFEQDRDYYWRRDVDQHHNEMDYRRLQRELEDMRRRDYNR